MPSKYDTNPLDADFPNKAGHSQHTQTLPNLNEETKVFTGIPLTEEPTRRYENGAFEQAQYNTYAYAQPQNLAQNQPQAAYQTTQLTAQDLGHDRPTSRKVEAIGLPENWMMMLSYAPFYIGMVASVIALLLAPRHETKVRFHASQGLALHIAIFAINCILGFIGNFSDWADRGNGIFTIVAMVIMIISMVKVWKGKPVHYEWLDNLTNWLNEKIKLNQKQ